MVRRFHLERGLNDHVGENDHGKHTRNGCAEGAYQCGSRGYGPNALRDYSDNFYHLAPYWLISDRNVDWWTPNSDFDIGFGLVCYQEILRGLCFLSECFQKYRNGLLYTGPIAIHKTYTVDYVGMKRSATSKNRREQFGFRIFFCWLSVGVSFSITFLQKVRIIDVSGHKIPSVVPVLPFALDCFVVAVFVPNQAVGRSIDVQRT